MDEEEEEQEEQEEEEEEEEQEEEQEEADVQRWWRLRRLRLVDPRSQMFPGMRSRELRSGLHSSNFVP